MKYHEATHVGYPQAFARAFAFSINLANQNGINELLIRIGMLQNAEGIMKEVLGDAFVKQLVKNKLAILPSPSGSISVFLEGDQTRRSQFRSGIVFAPWVTLDSLATVLADRRTVDSVYLPWLADELKSYCAANPDSIVI